MKKTFTVIISCLLLCAMLIPFVGCVKEATNAESESTSSQGGIESDSGSSDTESTSNSDSSDSENDEKNDPQPEMLMRSYDFSKSTEGFKLLGRMEKTSDGVTCDLTATGIEFSGYMSGKVIVALSCTADTYFTVYIDGVRSEERLFANSSTKNIVVADFEEGGEHTIRLVKQSEAQRSLCVLKKVVFYGYLNEAPEDRNTYIEIIGDSITCGYGNLWSQGAPGDAASALYEDGTKAFPFLTAEALGADCSVVGCSGVGIDKGWTAFSESDFYSQWCRYRNTNNPYDFGSARVPDLVIINLGTNDASRGSTEEGFKEKAKQLIEYIRAAYGKDVPIVYTYGMMGSARSEWMIPLLESMDGENAGLYYVPLNYNQSGGGGHPTVAAHELAAELLVDFLTSKGILKK